MKNCEDNDIFLSQIISGILLFKKKFNNLELLNIISMIYKKTKYEITEMDSIYDNVYRYLDNYDDFFALKDEYDYDSIVLVDGKKIKLYGFLLNNTTDYIIDFLSTNVYINKEIYSSFVRKNMFFKKFDSLKPKKKRKVKYEINY